MTPLLDKGTVVQYASYLMVDTKMSLVKSRVVNQATSISLFSNWARVDLRSLILPRRRALRRAGDKNAFSQVPCIQSSFSRITFFELDEDRFIKVQTCRVPCIQSSFSRITFFELDEGRFIKVKTCRVPCIESSFARITKFELGAS
jgi:hypothetical protein